MEERRSGNYGKSTWDINYIQRLTTPYGGEEYSERAEKLKDVVKIMIEETADALAQLQLINDLERLDVSHHFGHSVQKLLDIIYAADNKEIKNDLHATALKFRLLRQHGYHVSQEVFTTFIEESGYYKFKESLGADVKGLLSLYEACFLSMEDEPILDSAKDFTTRLLAKKLEQLSINDNLGEQIRHALELPLQWRVPKLQAIWYIKVYENTPHANLILLQYAKLYFNIAQANYQDEMKYILWENKRSGLGEKFSFSRERPAENFLWTLGFTPESHCGNTRVSMTKVAIMISVVDDIYDVYGTLQEIELFTNFIERWDINELDSLPQYMQMCFLGLDNVVNQLASDVLHNQSFNCISNLRRLLMYDMHVSVDRVVPKLHDRSEMVYTPSTNEYLSNAWISIAAPLILMHGYFCFTNPINKEEVQTVEQYPGIIRWAAMLSRLADDLGTSSEEIKRGDVPKSIQCYMHETGCCEEDARVYVKNQIYEIWKKMNKEILMAEKPFKKLGVAALNLARMCLSYYLNYGDSFGANPNSVTKDNLMSLVLHPIPMSST